jgi:hypothetical protein
MSDALEWRRAIARRGRGGHEQADKAVVDVMGGLIASPK